DGSFPKIKLTGAEPLPPLKPTPRDPAIGTAVLPHYRSDVLHPAPVFSTGAPVQRVVFNIINGPAVQARHRLDVPGGSWAGRFVLQTAEWNFVIDMRQDRTQTFDRLRRDGA